MAVKCRPMSHSQDPWMFVDFPGIHCFLLNYRDDFTNKSCIVSRCLVNNNMKTFSEILRLYHNNGTEISLYVMYMKWNPHSGMTLRCQAVIFTAPTFTAKQRNNRPWKSSNFTPVFSKFHEFHTSRVHQLHLSGTLMHKILKKFFNCFSFPRSDQTIRSAPYVGPQNSEKAAGYKSFKIPYRVGWGEQSRTWFTHCITLYITIVTTMYLLLTISPVCQ